MLNLIKKKNSGEIIGFGFCDFTKQLLADEEQIEINADDILEFLSKGYEIRDKRIVKKE